MCKAFLCEVLGRAGCIRGQMSGTDGKGEGTALG